MKSLLIASAALASAAAPCGSTSGPTTPVTSSACVTNHAVPDAIKTALPEARQRAAEAVCDNIRFADLSQLPPELASAGCTASGSYQLGLGQKPARYAICAATNGTCAAPKGTGRIPCNPTINKFVTRYQGEGGTYDFAHTVTSVCDACLTLALTSSVMVVWHENAYCFDDNTRHNTTIEQETGASPPREQPAAQPASAQPPPPGGSGSCNPLTTCAGGCMGPGAPAGL
jgi:hypothetical protein